MVTDRHRLLWVITSCLLCACGGGGSGSNPSPPLPPAPPIPAPAFVSEGLDDLAITEIREHNGRLFAATHDGLFGKQKGDSTWVPLGLNGFRVESIAIIDDTHWLAAVFDPIWDGWLNPGLMETLDSGTNWTALTTDWGGTNPDPEPVFSLEYHAPTQRLYASGSAVVAQSADFGARWQLLDGQWASGTTPFRALALNEGTQQLWYGGQNAIEELILRRYDFATGNVDSWLRLLPSPAVASSVTLDPSDPNRILVSGEGGILQSFDNGNTWEAPLGDVNHRFYFRTVMDPQNRAALFTVGWDKNFDSPQPLILEVSSDSGATWQQHAHDDPNLFGGAWSLHATVENGETVLYAGLFRGGMYRISF